jgi:PAS domain S-box-containing protein
MRHRRDRSPTKSGFPWIGSVVLCGRVALVLALAADAHAGKPAFRADPEYVINSWETDEGLPENSATAMAQASDGYLWFGTFEGVVRFDGLRFTVFDPSNTPALPAAGVVNLHLDRAGRLWVSTLSGLAVREGERWRRIGVPDGWRGEFFVRTFAERGNGDLLVTTFDGRVVEVVGERMRVLPAPPGEPGKGYFGFADDAGQWWVRQHRFIGRWDGARWVSGGDPGDAGANQVATAPARDGGWWVLVGRDLCKRRGGTEVARRTLGEVVQGVWSMSEDAAGNVWICTFDRGLYRAGADGQLRHWTTANGLAYDGVRFAFEDRERNVWVGTSGGGLMRFRPRAFVAVDSASGLAERVVNSVSADGQGAVWIGTYGKGVFKLSDGRVTPVPLADGAGRVEYVQSVLADRGGRVWVGTFNQGLWRVEGGEGRRVGGAGLNGENVLSLFEDSRGRVWVGGGQGLWVFDAGEFRMCGGDGRAVRAVCGFAEGAGGDVWMANGDSVFRFHEGRVDAVTTADGQPIRDVTCLKVDADAAVWMGTRRSGLLRWRDGRVARVDAAGGLPAEAVHAIVEDDGGYFWMTSNRGVLRALRRDLDAAADGQRDLPGLRCRVFDKGDGLPSAEGASGRQPVASRDRGGRLWLATPKGVAFIDPAGVGASPAPPPTSVEALIYEDDPGRRADGRKGHGARRTRLLPPFDGRVILPAGSRNVEFRYAGLSLGAPERVRFQIRIDGRDADWQDVGTERVAHYYDPRPGDYVFRVRAAGPDGAWDGAGARLAFRVRPYFWQTLWFGAGAAGVLAAGGAGGVAWMVRRRYRRLTESARVLRESEERFRLVFETAPNGLVMVDARGHMVMVNAEIERVFGYRREALVGRPLGTLLPEGRDAGGRVGDGDGRPSRAEADGNGARAGHELRGRRADGREMPVEIGLSPMETAAGRFLLCSITDVSERRRAESQAAQLRNELAHLSRVTMLGELSGSLAHELNQPLTSILSNAQAAQHFLARRDPEVGEVREILADIVAEDKRAGEVIRRLRALFKKGEVQRQELDVNEVLEDVLKLARSDLINYGVAVDVRPATGLPPVMGDRVQLQQVLLNVIKNGCDAMEAVAPGERRLDVTSGLAPGGGASVDVSIRDHGTGVPPADLERIFAPFVTTKAGGMGLGLAVCRTIIQGHGGRLWLENNPGRGATVHLVLPVARNESRGGDAEGELDQSPIVAGRAGG